MNHGLKLSLLLLLSFFMQNIRAQSSFYEKALNAYYRYEYIESIELFEKFKSLTDEPKKQLKADALIAISNIYLGEYEKAINNLNQGFTKATNLYGETSLEVSDFYLGFGKYYEILEVYDTALIFNNAALTIKRIYLQDDHKDLIDVYVNMGVAYDYSGQYDSAIVYYQKGLTNTIKNLGKIHPYSEYLCNDMGVVYGFLERHEDALEIAEKALNIRTSLYGISSSEVAQSYHNIAVSLDALKKYEDALGNYQKAFDLKQKLFAEKSEEMAGAYYSLGNSYSRNNQFQKAIEYNKKAYQIALSLYGKKHHLSVKYLKNIGNVSFDGGLYKEAIEYYLAYQKVATEMQISNSELAEVHLYIGQSYENLGDYQRAEENFNKALDSSKDDDVVVYNVLVSMARIRDLKSDFNESIRLLEEALKLVGDDSEESGFIFNNLASVYINISDYNQAKICLDKSLEIRTKYFGTESNEISQTFSTFGNYFKELERFELSLEYYKKAYAIKKRNYPENHPILTSALFNLSVAYGNLNDYIKELELLERTLKSNEINYGQGYIGNSSVYINLCLNYDKQGKIGEAMRYGKMAVEANAQNYGDQSEQIADALAVYATVQHNFGKSQEAIKDAQRALYIYESLFDRDHVKVANQFNNLGVTFMELQEYEKSQSYFHKALSSYRNVFGEKNSYVASTLSNLALIEYQRSEYEKGIKLFNEAIKLGNNLGDAHLLNQATTFQNLALCYRMNFDREKAIAHLRKALSIKKKILGNSNQEVGDLMINIGNYHLAQNTFDSSEYYFNKALDNYIEYYGEEGERVAGAYNNLTELSLKLGDYDEALKFNKMALKANDEQSFKQAFVSYVSTSDINFLLYQRTREIQYLQNAFQSSLEADQLLSKAESELYREEDKLAFSTYKSLLTNIAIKNANELYTSTNDLKYFDKALYFAERSKSGVLLSALKLSNVKQFKDIDSDLIQKEKMLNRNIQLVSQQLFKSSESKSDQQVSGLKNKLFELNRELETIRKIEKERFQKHYSIDNPDLASLSSLRADLNSKPSTAFIEYALSDSTLQAIVVTKANQKILSIPLNEKFENKLKAFRKAVMFKADNVLNLISEDIYKVVFEPVEKFFKESDLSIDEIIIIPEGGLNYLPFEALFRNKDGRHQYLIENYAISYAYSLSLYDFINNRQSAPTQNSCLSFAPVFPETSETSTMNVEAKNLFASASSSMTDVSRAFTLNGSFVAALPGTEVEVKAIHEVAESSGLSSKYFIHEEAEEGILKSGILKDYRYLHFATHGFINESDPSFSGILMSQNKDSKEDCVLYASEIYNLEVNADLVTLSACETGLGKMAFGEGIVGLTRSFLYAGASNLLVSQWKVNDESTSKMMIDFYDKIFSGQSKSKALREAKLTILKNEKFRNPYYWAPFVLIGQ